MPINTKGARVGPVWDRFRAVGLWLDLDTVPAKELHGENYIRVLLEMERGATAKVTGPILSLWV